MKFTLIVSPDFARLHSRHLNQVQDILAANPRYSYNNLNRILTRPGNSSVIYDIGYDIKGCYKFLSIHIVEVYCDDDVSQDVQDFLKSRIRL